MRGIREITRRIEAAGLRYCLVGGLAAIAYGRPRLTLDADLLLAVAPGQIRRLLEQFPSEDFYIPPDEVLLEECRRESRGHFNIIHMHSALRADCYLPGTNRLALWELSHRVKVPTDFGEDWFAPAVSVIAMKLLYFREGGSQKHLEDIAGMLDAGAVVPEDDNLGSLLSELHLEKEWDMALALHTGGASHE